MMKQFRGGASSLNKLKAKTNYHSSAPNFAQVGAGAIRVTHREYIQEVRSATNAFELNKTFHINVGDKENFPWLARIAHNFQRYRLNSCTFHFNSTSGSVSSTQALGEVVGAYHDNVTTAVPQNKQQLLQLSKSASCVTSNNCSFPIPVEGKFRYVRGVVGQGTDSHGTRDTYDEGKFFLATQGTPGTDVNVGELWVSYDVTLDGKAAAGMVEGTGSGGYARLAQKAAFDGDYVTVIADSNGPMAATATNLSKIKSESAGGLAMTYSDDGSGDIIKLSGATVGSFVQVVVEIRGFNGAMAGMWTETATGEMSTATLVPMTGSGLVAVTKAWDGAGGAQPSTTPEQQAHLRLGAATTSCVFTYRMIFRVDQATSAENASRLQCSGFDDAQTTLITGQSYTATIEAIDLGPHFAAFKSYVDWA